MTHYLRIKQDWKLTNGVLYTTNQNQSTPHTPTSIVIYEIYIKNIKKKFKGWPRGERKKYKYFMKIQI